ncbi:MAG: hypothetical protein Q9162_004728 [Coniocarpon cinnabarinum]
MAPIAVALLGGLLAARAAAHGFVSQVKIGSTYYQGYDPTKYPYITPAPTVAGWTDNNLGIGFVAPDQYQNPNIICHNDATPGKTHIPVAAGQAVSLLWTPWPDTHLGPIITYMANCNGACETVDKTKLQFVKVDASGLITPGSPGTWATTNMIANNNTYTVTIPKNLAAGNYVMRHEIIALHSAGSVDGAQNYPSCINFAVTGSGTAKPAGTLGEQLYTENDPGILFNLYKQNDNYPMPGPALFTG